jgi:DNA-3-methyladenine glycosylase II
MPECISHQNFHPTVDLLSERDPSLKKIFDLYGYPPLWERENTYETLVLTILEQQVSLASAMAAYRKLKAVLPVISPEGLLSLSDEILRSCYLTRQKIVYTRELAHAIMGGKVDLEEYAVMNDEDIRHDIKKVKGIGDWTADIYLLHALRRADIFPIGDIALINAIRMVKENLQLSREEIISLSMNWQPYRSVAVMMFWHYYIKVKGLKMPAAV